MPVKLNADSVGAASLEVRRRAVTLKDVAARAGVGPMSVSVVLNGTQSATRVSDATRERILHAAAELGYRRNGGAAAARSGRFGNVALLLSTDPCRSFMPEGLFQGVHDELADNDLLMTLARFPDEKLTDSHFVPKILRELSCDGLLVDYNYDIPVRLVEMIEKFQIPAIWLNIEQPNDSVFPDDEGATFDATQHLLQLGHRRIMYLNHTTSEHDSVKNRLNGYTRAMKNAGYAAMVENVDYDEDTAGLFARMQGWLTSPEAPTAFLTYEEHSAVAIWLAAEKLGYHVPEDISVVTIHNREVRVLGRKLSYWEIPVFEIGRESVHMLLRKMEQPGRKLESKKIPFLVKPGQTCAPCKVQ